MEVQRRKERENRRGTTDLTRNNILAALGLEQMVKKQQ